MALSDKSDSTFFETLRQALIDEGAGPVTERLAKRLRKLKEPEIAAALISAWQENNQLRQLQETGRALTTELDLDTLLNAILDAAITVMGAERGCLMLADSDAGLAVKVARKMAGSAADAGELRVSHSVAERVYRSGEPLLSTNAEEDDRFSSSQSIMEYQLRSILCVPLKTAVWTLGVLYMDNRTVKGMFDAQALGLLELFAGQAAVALENARLHGELLAAKQQKEVELVGVRRELSASHRDLGLKYNYDRIIGTSKPMLEIFRLLDRTTDTAVPVLITGESGTGKELVAKAIHYNGPRKAALFTAENVSAISETLLESELFGHVKGSFTGAMGDKLGLFEVADGGTLFLDEIGDMSKNLQAKVLRALQEGEIRRVGGKETIKVDVRIISATHRDLEEMIASGDFRQDLYYRLNVIKIPLPPLRDRREDIPLLVRHFLDQLAEKSASSKRTLSDAALGVLVAYDWPGNVREMENEVTRAVVMSDETIEPADLSERLTRRPAGGGAVGALAAAGMAALAGERPLKDLVEELERQIILRKLDETHGNKSASAKALGLSRDGLRKKLIRYGLDRNDG